MNTSDLPSDEVMADVYANLQAWFDELRDSINGYRMLRAKHSAHVNSTDVSPVVFSHLIDSDQMARGNIELENIDPAYRQMFLELWINAYASRGLQIVTELRAGFEALFTLLYGGRVPPSQGSTPEEAKGG